MVGYVKTYQVIPSVCYGFASGPLVDIGAQTKACFFFPTMIGLGVKRGAMFHVGKGENVYNNVNIQDRKHTHQYMRSIESDDTRLTVADLYYLLIDAIFQGAPVGHGRDGHYMGENGTHTLQEISKAIAVPLHKAGALQSDEPTPLTAEEIKASPLVSRYPSA